MRRLGFWISGFLWWSAGAPLWAGSATATNDIEALVRDLTAVERVYYNHRTDDKPPFEQAVPRAAAETLVRQDLRKEAVLKKVYGIEVTPPQIESEMRRMIAAAGAPDILAELQGVLSNDPVRFARTIVRPIVVDRTLRDKFDRDEALHAAPRREIEKVRAQLLEVRRNADSGAMTIRPGQAVVSDVPTNVIERLVTILKSSPTGRTGEATWRLTPPSPETNAPAGAPVLSPRTNPGGERTSEDLPAPLQDILRVQLREPGDVSAVVDTPAAYLLFVVRELHGEQLRVATLAVPKRSYEEWLNAPDEKKP